MLNLLEIRRKDIATREGGGAFRIVAQVAITIAVCFLSIFFSDLSIDFLAAVLAVQSILAGFGFNVLVFLTGNKQINVPSSAKIERRLKINRVNILGREIFYNISYFNTLAVCCIAAALCIATTKSFDVKELSELWSARYVLTEDGVSLIRCFRTASSMIAAAVLYLLLIKTVLTFLRIIQRSTYYFEQKIKLSEDV